MRVKAVSDRARIAYMQVIGCTAEPMKCDTSHSLFKVSKGSAVRDTSKAYRPILTVSTPVMLRSFGVNPVGLSVPDSDDPR